MQKQIIKQAVVSAARSDVYDAFTTTDGATTFFGPRANVEKRLLGAYEILFDLEEEPGRQGGEDCRMLAFLELELLSFEWNAPPQFPNARNEKTFVVVRFHEAPGGTRVELVHAGFGEGEEWDAVHAYFERAWGLVMHWLVHRFSVGPIDWDSPPRPA